MSRPLTRRPAVRVISTSVFVVGLSCTVPLAGCGRSQPPPAPLPPPEVAVTTPTAREVTEYFNYVGRVRAIDRVEVRAQVSGYLISTGFTDGEQVAKGQTLFEIDPRPFEASLAAANAQKSAANASLAEATARLKRYDQALAAGAITSDEYETVLAEKLTAEAQIEAADAQILTAGLDLEFATVKAPIAGRIGETIVDPGNLVVGGVGSEPLATVVSEDPIEVEFDVDERAVAEYWRNNRAEIGSSRPEDIRAGAYPIEIGMIGETGYPHSGIITFVDNAFDPSTGTIGVRGEFENGTRYLAPGMFVRVRISSGPPSPALLVPDRAVGTDQERKYLLVADGNDVATYFEVDLGPLQDDGMRVVTAIGDNKGDFGADSRVILDGFAAVRPGVTVKPTSGPNE
ncbi:MAG: efflux RND transporter periplasmic adaptor subunit [Planctomycetota bacterium]